MRFDGEDEICSEDSNELDAAMLREELVAELQAINQYHEHVELLSDEAAREMAQRHINEEKEHVAALVRLVMKLDPAQAEKFRMMGLVAPLD